MKNKRSFPRILQRSFPRIVKLSTIVRLLAVLLGFVPLVMLLPMIMAIVLGEYSMIRAFVIPMIIVAIPAVLGFLSLRGKNLNLNTKDGFFLVFASWVLASLAGSVPFHFWGLSFSDAIFESVCTFTTTGATTIINIEALPRSLLFWRSIAHWFGGIGIVLVSVALLPLLGVGGFQLIKAEETALEKEKFTPKIANTAKLLLLAYSTLTLLLFFLYLAGGMNLFEALCYSMTIMASGGVSIKNEGLGSYNSAFIDVVTTVFMLLATINFGIYYRLLRGKFREIAKNTEVRAYLCIFLAASAVMAVSLVSVYGSFSSALRYAAFHSASILSSTGASVSNYEQWPAFAGAIIFGLMFIGGCSGSTAGGVKVIRHVILWKQVKNEFQKLFHPHGVFTIKINKRVGRRDIIYGAAGFFFIYFAAVAAATLITSASGVDIFSSFTASLSMAGNIGAGFGYAGPSGNYSIFADHVKWLFSFLMIAGRLEMWTVFVLFTRMYHGR